MIKISVQINVPDGEFCSGCDLWYRVKNGRCHCLLFGMIELGQRYRANMVSGTDIVKCSRCQEACEGYLINVEKEVDPNANT